MNYVELFQDFEADVTLYVDFGRELIKLYDSGNYYTFEFSELDYHKTHCHFNTYTKALFDLCNSNYDGTIEELEDLFKEVK